MSSAGNEYSAPLRTRSLDLDILKGMLVLVMLTYHCSSVTEGSRWGSSLEMIAVRVSFIHYAFIVISGYLCGWYYMPRLAASEAGVRRRIAIRGVKLLALLFSLNFLKYLLNVGHIANELSAEIISLDALIKNFVLGMNGKFVSFEILYYIGMLLIAASFVLGRFHVLPLVIITLLFYEAPSDWKLFHVLAFGMVGIIVGVMAAGEHLHRFWRIIELTYGIPIILCLCVDQLFFSQIRAVVSMLHVRWLYFLFETCLWFLSFIFLFRLRGVNKVGDIIVRLGRYTLLAYISQMVILRLVFALLIRSDISATAYYLTSWLVSACILYSVVLAVEYLRRHLNSVNYVYRGIFE